MSVRTLIEKIGQEKLLENFSQTDKSLKDVVSGDIGANLVEQLAVKYGVDSDYFSDLMMLLSLFVSKSINTQEFVNELFTFVPDQYFPQFLQELEDKLWSPYDVYLNKAGVVYKQLTKLTPQPITNNEQQATETIPVAAGAELGIENKELSVEKSQQVQDSGLKIEEPKINIPAVQVEPPKVPEPVQQTTDNLKPTTETDIKQQKTNGVVISELPETPKPSKPMVISDVSPAGEKREIEIPPPPASTEGFGEAKHARVKFDSPRVGPQIFKPTESAITPKASEVKFVGPEIKPEVSGNVPPASSQWQKPRFPADK